MTGILVVFVPSDSSGRAGGSGSIEGDPKALVVTPRDLPVDFALAGGDHQGPGEYMAVYFRPEVLAAPEPTEGDLLGVMVGVRLSAHVAEAQEYLAADGTVEAIRRSAQSASPGQNLTAVDQLEPSLPGADEVLLFHLHYELAGVEVVEYRYLLRLANAVANVIVSGRKGQQSEEPPALADQARRIAERQVGRLAGARQ